MTASPAVYSNMTAILQPVIQQLPIISNTRGPSMLITHQGQLFRYHGFSSSALMLLARYRRDKRLTGLTVDSVQVLQDQPGHQLRH